MIPQQMSVSLVMGARFARIARMRQAGKRDRGPNRVRNYAIGKSDTGGEGPPPVHDVPADSSDRLVDGLARGGRVCGHCFGHGRLALVAVAGCAQFRLTILVGKSLA